MIKDSALVSVLGVADITQLGKVYAAGSFRFFETYNVVAFLYLVMTVGLSLALRGLERRLRGKDRAPLGLRPAARARIACRRRREELPWACPRSSPAASRWSAPPRS